MSNTRMTLDDCTQRIDALCSRYRFVKKKVIGKSYCGAPIASLIFGCGKKLTVAVGTHHASEYLTAFLLLEFAEELARGLDAGEKRFGLDLRSLVECRSLALIPCLNPDGMKLVTEGLCEKSPFAERLLAYNRQSRDFTHWKANARGVDLNHNYDYRFVEYKSLERRYGITAGATRYAGEYPESEPETRALCRFLRENRQALAAVLTFHSQGEVIYYHDYRESRRGAAFLARTTGYRLEDATGFAAYGGLSDWLSKDHIPAYTLEIGKGENPLPEESLPYLYASLREMFFRSLAFF